MYMTHHAPPNGLDPGDRMPGNSSLDEMDELMSDWSWREGQADPGYVYTPNEIKDYERFASLGVPMPAMRPWSFPAYTGSAVPPKRIGG